MRDLIEVLLLTLIVVIITILLLPLKPLRITRDLIWTIKKKNY